MRLISVRRAAGGVLKEAFTCLFPFREQHELVAARLGPDGLKVEDADPLFKPPGEAGHAEAYEPEAETYHEIGGKYPVGPALADDDPRLRELNNADDVGYGGVFEQGDKKAHK